MENLEKTMAIFVRLAGYQNVLAFPSKFINVDFKAGFLFVKVRKKSKYPITSKFVFLTNVAQFLCLKTSLLTQIYTPWYAFP